MKGQSLLNKQLDVHGEGIAICKVKPKTRKAVDIFGVHSLVMYVSGLEVFTNQLVAPIFQNDQVMWVR